MVKIQPLSPAGGTGLGRLYRTTVPVGQPRGRGDGTNSDVRDVQLVQFFLRVFFRKKPELMPKLPGRSGFLIDGKVGTQTVEGIHRFQDDFGNHGKLLFDDSRVSVALGKHVPGTTAFWTIDALNAFAFVTLGAKQFNSLFSNSEINAEAPELTVNLVNEEQLNAPFN